MDRYLAESLIGMTEELRAIKGVLNELLTLQKQQIPQGFLYDNRDQVTTSQWRQIRFTWPLFGFTIRNTSLVGGISLEYRLHNNTAMNGSVDVGDVVRFSSNYPIYTGLDIRLPVGTTGTGSFEIDGVA